jgi:hypothetical protein
MFQHSNFAIALTALCLCFTATASQQSTRVVESTNSGKLALTSETLPVLRTGKSTTAIQAPERLRHKSREVGEAPKPMGKKEYQSLTGKSKGQASSNNTVQAGEKPRLEYLKLTPRKNYTGFGWLEFSQLQHHDPKDQFASFFRVGEDDTGWAKAFLKVDKGERYLVDFSVNTGANLKFHISTDAGTTDISLVKGAHHLLVYLDALETETTSVTLTADNAIFAFYSVEITRTD